MDLRGLLALRRREGAKSEVLNCLAAQFPCPQRKKSGTQGNANESKRGLSHIRISCGKVSEVLYKDPPPKFTPSFYLWQFLYKLFNPLQSLTVQQVPAGNSRVNIIQSCKYYFLLDKFCFKIM